MKFGVMLKPCPFCGGCPKISVQPAPSAYGTSFQVSLGCSGARCQYQPGNSGSYRFAGEMWTGLAGREPDYTETVVKAVKSVAKIWNRRSKSEKMYKR